MMVSISLRWSGVNPAAPAGDAGSRANHSAVSAAAAQPIRKLIFNNLLNWRGSPLSAGSIVEVFGFAANLIGAQVGRGILRQQLLRAHRLLLRILLFSRRQRRLRQ